MDAYEQLLYLLRAALWERGVDSSCFPAETKWGDIYRLAQQQTVAALIYDALASLPAEQQPEPAFLRQWYVHLIKVEQSHKLLNQRLAEVTTLLRSEEIRSVLLKGQGVAQNYPNPARRQCGDIDLYIGKENYKKACDIAQKWDSAQEVERDDTKHYSFHWRGVTIELHRIALFLRKFQHWTEYHLMGDKLRRWSIDGTEVLLPPVNFDALYIFNHAYSHFILGGIGLRQLCDWALYLHTFANEIDRQQLKHDLDSFGLMRVWQIFGHIAVSYLGLVENEMPFYTDRYKKRAEKVLGYILKDGNFGHHSSSSKPSKNFLKRKLCTLLRILQRAWRLLSLFPKDTITYLISFIPNGISAVTNDLFRIGRK
jgi:hypothetical protein